jgi:hypothetical protein
MWFRRLVDIAFVTAVVLGAIVIALAIASALA